MTDDLLHQAVSLCHSRPKTSFYFSHLFRGRVLELDGNDEATVVAAVVVVSAVVVLVVLRDARRG